MFTLLPSFSLCYAIICWLKSRYIVYLRTARSAWPVFFIKTIRICIDRIYVIIDFKHFYFICRQFLFAYLLYCNGQKPLLYKISWNLALQNQFHIIIYRTIKCDNVIVQTTIMYSSIDRYTLLLHVILTRMLCDGH